MQKSFLGGNKCNWEFSIVMRPIRFRCKIAQLHGCILSSCWLLKPYKTKVLYFLIQAFIPYLESINRYEAPTDVNNWLDGCTYPG